MFSQEKLATLFPGPGVLLRPNFLHSLIPQWSRMLQELNPHLEQEQSSPSCIIFALEDIKYLQSFVKIGVEFDP
jgi:hypothetical protein